MSQECRILSAIMFTDVVGYSALSQKNEALALELLEAHRALLRPLFHEYFGQEIKTIGDAFLVEFSSVVDAVQCALEAQRTLYAFNAGKPDDHKIRIRIGLHVGDVVHKEGDIYGDGVNIASRVQPLAEPGGICFTDQVYIQIRNKSEFPIVSFGKRRLKNIEKPVEIFGLAHPWLGKKPTLAKTASPAEATNLRRRILWAISVFILIGGLSAILFLKTAVDSLAVLPLKNNSGDPALEYFADGMTEMIIGELSKIKALRVISRTSVMPYKNTQKSLPEIGRALKVGAVVEGSAALQQKMAKIAARLVKAKNEQMLMSKDYNKDLDDVLYLQSVIARDIAKEIKIKITPEELKRLAATKTVKGEAQEAYLKGRYYLNKFSLEGVQQAVSYFQEAQRIDPGYALPCAGLAEAYDVAIAMDVYKPKEGWPLVKAEAEKALRLDETVAEAQAMLGDYYFIYEWNWSEADKAYRRAVELSPGYSIGENWYGMFLLAMGRFDEALARVKHAKELDPLTTQNVNVGLAYHLAGRYDDAIREFKDILALEPDFAIGHLNLGKAYLEKGMMDEALAEFQKSVELEKGSLDNPNLACVYALSGRPETAKDILKKLIQQAREGGYPSDRIALVYSTLGDKESAFEWLEKAGRERAYDMIMIKVEPRFKSLHSDPRFKELLKKMGLEK